MFRFRTTAVLLSVVYLANGCFNDRAGGRFGALVPALFSVGSLLGRPCGAAVRLLARLVVHPQLNPWAGDFFPASYSPLIKRLSKHGTANRIVASILGPMLDVPAGLRQLLIRLVLLNGTAFQATLADDRAFEAFVRQSVLGVWHPVGPHGRSRRPHGGGQS
ncbi:MULTISPECIES: hypothetical protein [unclassified Bradyrhizobium]|uniref:hypothetical protein n=1 Tax=unclassified Bradyrhizobium TaxID=2631580 RepID=UPI001FF9B422|nr:MULTISPECIES: hypothetical protein [unclassified Bradyrhizobium]